jgi:2-polyprenyl-3-methyl-5-hydroxy-6-metoxy-1,4-benzoquinol methylase
MNVQARQEKEYAFPYHYVSHFEHGFGQTFYDDWGIHYVSTIEYLLHRLRSLQWQSVIDIGCGDGRMSRELALHFPEHKVTGIDYSDRAIMLAQAMNADLPGLHFEKRDIIADIHPAKHDAMILMEVLEHIPPSDTPAFVAALHRQLVPGGHLLLTVPHINKPVEYKHYRHFDSASLRLALGPNFEILELVPFERHNLHQRLLRFILGNRYFILNHRGMLNRLYDHYRRRLFACRHEDECQRLFVLARAR